MAMTAEQLLNQFEILKAKEKEHFLARLMKLMAQRAFPEASHPHAKTYSRREVFGDLDGALFTFAEACEYLERSAPQVRRYVADQAILPSKTIGKNQMFELTALRAFKKTLRLKPASGTKRVR